jgi:adenylate cyclase
VSEAKRLSVDASLRFLRRRRTLLFFAIATFLTVVAVLPHFSRFKFVTALEQDILSLQFLVRDKIVGAGKLSEDHTPIVIVGVDDASLYPVLNEEDLAKHPEAAFMKEPWPWNRSIHGLIAQKLFDAGARVVALDFLFPTQNPGDWEFYEVIEANLGRIVIGYDYIPKESELQQGWMTERLPTEDLLPLENEDQMLGFVNVEKDSDGVLRRAKLHTNIYAENLMFMDDPLQRKRAVRLAGSAKPSFSFAARAALLLDPSVQEYIPPREKPPIIDYAGDSYFPFISYFDVVFDDRFNLQKELIDGAIVMIGPYSDFFKDIVNTPYGMMYGVETHAHVVRSLLNRSFFTEPSRLAFTVISFISGLALLIGNLRFKAVLSKAGWTIGLVVAYLVFAQIVFSHFRVVFPVIPILWILGGAGSVFIIYDFVLTQYERSKLRSYLSRYVSSEVAQVLANESSELELLLNGASRPIAVLFSDIRGFTTLSERYTPVGLVGHLNDYFESMVDSIHLHSGILNKYIGDAILAVWGGLLSNGPEQNCLNAVQSALDMEKRMIELNRKWEEDADKLPLAIGIGISYGEAFVGNMGHSNRMEFAVMGDVVNLGSRLEGATKQYGCGILVSEEVYHLCREEIRFREIDIIQVKGKTKGIRTYSPVNRMDQPAPDWFDQWESALKHYRSRDFVTALAQFSKLETKVAELKQSAALYRERTEDLIQNPPPENWDFVYIMKTK